MTNWNTIGAVLIFITSFYGASCFAIDQEASLRTKLFTNNSYDVNVRPESLIRVTATFNLMTISDLNIKDQTFKVSGWLTLTWRDLRLSWTRADFANIGFIFATEADVWRPALIVANSIDNLGIIQDAYTPFRITSMGTIVWEPPGIYEVHCVADISYYPFDEQECHIIISSWGYNLLEVNVSYTGSGINMDEFKPNGEWDLTEVKTIRDDNVDSKGDEYGRVKFFFKMKRKSEYYWLNVLLPVIINSVLTALVFALPAESGEKMGYSLTVLLSFAVLLTLIADKIPSTSINTSLIVVYFSIVLVLGALAVLLSTVVLDIYFTDPADPIPDWVKKSFRFLGKILCYEGCHKRKKTNRINVSGETARDIPLEFQKSFSPMKTSSTPPPTIKAELMRSMDVKPNSKHWYTRSIEDQITWKDISRILDVFLLRLYLVTIAIVTVTFVLVAFYNVG